MAPEYETLAISTTLPAPRVARSSIPWRRVVPLALLVPIVAAFGTPILGFALLAVILAAPVVVGALALAAARAERRA